MNLESDIELFDWCESHVFPVKISGVNEFGFVGKSFGPRESLWVIILTELFVNAIKHFDIASGCPLAISWSKDDEWAEFSCTNPSTFESRNRSRGTGRGHQFLRLIAEKVDGEFVAPGTTDVAVTVFRVPTILVQGAVA